MPILAQQLTVCHGSLRPADGPCALAGHAVYTSMYRQRTDADTISVENNDAALFQRVYWAMPATSYPLLRM